MKTSARTSRRRYRKIPRQNPNKTTVSVKDAVATLTGSVGSYAEKQLDRPDCQGRQGSQGGPQSDSRSTIKRNALTRKLPPTVKARLQWDIWINGDLINPVVKDGKVTLTGTIGSAISKSRAFDDAWVNGVTAVDDSGLKIEPQAHNGAQQKSKTAISSDSEIKQAVQAALRLDPRVSAFSPDVTVEDGVVTLGGSVGNLKAKTAAAQDAKNVVGVARVENHLKVRPTGGALIRRRWRNN